LLERTRAIGPATRDVLAAQARYRKHVEETLRRNIAPAARDNANPIFDGAAEMAWNSAKEFWKSAL
jgi:hypothetical protein